jgi:hypothetical protein
MLSAPLQLSWLLLVISLDKTSGESGEGVIEEGSASSLSRNTKLDENLLFYHQPTFFQG